MPHPPDDSALLHQARVPEGDRTQTSLSHPLDDGGDLLHDCQELTTEVLYTTEEAQAVESLEDIQLFAEFPTPALLRDANNQYAKFKGPVEYYSEGVVEPYPVASRKQSVFDLQKHQDLDLHCVQVCTCMTGCFNSYTRCTVQLACRKCINKFVIKKFSGLPCRFLQAPETLLHKPLQSLVDYLVWPAKSDVQKARALFCWLTAQNLSTLDVTSAVDGTLLSYLKRLKNSQLSYNQFYSEMCP